MKSNENTIPNFQSSIGESYMISVDTENINVSDIANPAGSLDGFILEIIDEESKFFGWKFKIDGIQLNENKIIDKKDDSKSSHLDCNIISADEEIVDEAEYDPEKPLTLGIDYDIMNPSLDEVIETYGDCQHEEILNALGGYIVDFILTAIINKSFHIQDNDS